MTSEPGREAAGQHQTRSKPEHQPRADRYDHFNQGGEPCLQCPRAQSDLDILEALFLQAMHFVILARERLYHAHGGKHLLHYGNHLALFFAHLARSFSDAARVFENDQPEHRRNRQCNQRKLPVDVEHHADHADQGQDIDQRVEQVRADKGLDGIDVAGHGAEQVSRAFLIVIGERQPLDVEVERLPQIVHDPLADAWW